MTKRKSEAKRENDARKRAAIKEWTKKLGHKPTPEDMQRALIVAAPAQRKHEKEEFERGKKASGVTKILEFVQQAMDMPRNCTRAIPMANAICQHYSGDVVAAGKDGGQISAAVCTRRHGNNVAVQAG